jgi:hypothetical protein
MTGRRNHNMTRRLSEVRSLRKGERHFIGMFPTPRTLRWGACVLASLALSCGSPSGPTESGPTDRTLGTAPTATSPAAQILSVRIVPEISELRVNATQWFHFTVELGPGYPPSGPLPLWSSSDPSIVSVDGSGKVTALAPGISVLSVMFRGKSDMRQLRVSAN